MISFPLWSQSENVSDGSKNPRLRIVTAISLCNSSGCRFVITTSFLLLLLLLLLLLFDRYFIAVLFSFQMLSLYYMQALFRDLRDLGYHQLALPVVAMQQLIADLVFDNSQLKKLVHLR